MIHRHTLALKTLPNPIQDVLNPIIKTVNNVKSRASTFCFSSKNVRKWIQSISTSRENLADQVFELQQELKSILSDQGKNEMYPVWKITILFSTWHILLTYFNNSIKLKSGDEVNVHITSEYGYGVCTVPSRIIKTNLDLVKYYFVVPVKNTAYCMQDELTDLQNDSGAKYMFKTNTICDFWLKVSDDYFKCWKINFREDTSLPQHIFP